MFSPAGKPMVRVLLESTDEKTDSKFPWSTVFIYYPVKKGELFRFDHKDENKQNLCEYVALLLLN